MQGIDVITVILHGKLARETTDGFLKHSLESGNVVQQIHFLHLGDFVIIQNQTGRVSEGCDRACLANCPVVRVYLRNYPADIRYPAGKDFRMPKKSSINVPSGCKPLSGYPGKPEVITQNSGCLNGFHFCGFDGILTVF